MTMKIDEIVTLIKAVSENGVTHFQYEDDNNSLRIDKKEKKYIVQTAPGQELLTMSPGMPESSYVTAPAALTPAQSPAVPEISSDKVVSSPLVGTFYSAASPDDEPFVKVGDTVKKGQVLGIIEAMKLMNEIESEYDGVVEAVLVNNEDVVEYGQPLFRLK